MKKEDAKPGMKVHVLGRGTQVLYITEIGNNTATISSDRSATNGTGILYERLVKFKDQF